LLSEELAAHYLCGRSGQKRLLVNDVISPAVNDVISPAVNDVISPAVNDVISPAVNDVISPAVNDDCFLDRNVRFLSHR
jgi:large-conductance mechanosensitive channel